jgi:hypothetical protein
MALLDVRTEPVIAIFITIYWLAEIELSHFRLNTAEIMVVSVFAFFPLSVWVFLAF